MSSLVSIPNDLPEELVTVQDFQQLMQRVRNMRRDVVKNLLEKREVDLQAHIDFFRFARKTLKTDTNGSKRNFKADTSPDSPELVFDLKDELAELEMDVACLPHYNGGNLAASLSQILGSFHPINLEKFNEERKNLESMFNQIFPNQDGILITDWDGTMKNYGCNYNTCMQPAYSAVIIARFARQMTKLAAVLTAGPLQNPGILDLTAIPPDGWVCIGGSWGREWMIEGKTTVDDSVFTPESRLALEGLGEAILVLLSQKLFSPFAFVGSGFQRKVDRITLGIQNISKDIVAQQTEDYVEEVLKRLGIVDPEHRLFVVHREELDMEIILKTPSTGTAWNKASGIEFLLKQANLQPEDGTVLICGDTESDLPMVGFSLSHNPLNTYAVFVNPSEKVRTRLAQMYCEQPTHYSIVSSPQVIHAVMVDLLNAQHIKNNVIP